MRIRTLELNNEIMFCVEEQFGSKWECSKTFFTQEEAEAYVDYLDNKLEERKCGL